MRWRCLGSTPHTEVFVSHRDARLTVHGRRILVERVLSDNGSCYRSKLFTQSLTAAGIAHHERTAALSDFLHTYHHRCHTALGGHPPINCVNNAAGQYT
ncbi:hypothetical protein SVTN_37230 [Streptomyces vietnamensis]|uniref:Uncharacterized protein n=1 Tax=Streptomyces vietnamensis TaxID=362257 RepID=A0A0B5I4S8_9ACTN|nr:leucine zipper domain-containing protein [Streptomyces vietnamensis]AJF69105.1 hypothetical protein SVTN_37230 [Streptomyces vietnamensis]